MSPACGSWRPGRSAPASCSCATGRRKAPAAGRLLGAVLDSGISLIDTSIDYGRSEELIGRYLGHRRGEYFLASKCGCLLGDPPAGATPPFPHDYSPGNVRAGIEQSLRRLGTGHLDLVQVHMSPSRAQLQADQTVETLLSLRQEGAFLAWWSGRELTRSELHQSGAVREALQAAAEVASLTCARAGAEPPWTAEVRGRPGWRRAR
jgi:aryl-alcohol dehydrogenase-like predicted oxidoreductase